VFYKKLIHGVPLKNVTSHFAMEKIKSITGAADVGPDGRVNTGPVCRTRCSPGDRQN